MDNSYIVKAVPDGFVDQASVRSRVFKKTCTVDGTVNAGDKLAASTEYSLFTLPEGFIPRYAVVNVLKANASAASLTIKASKNGGGSASINGTSSTAAAGTVGKTLIAFATASSAGLDPWLAGANDVISVTASADVDAKFEVVVVGDLVDLAK